MTDFLPGAPLTPSELQSITPAELASRLALEQSDSSEWLLLDVREPEEREFVSIPNSEWIPMGELMFRLQEIQEKQTGTLVIYCHHGIRSHHAGRFLLEQGFQNVFNLTGGIDRWSMEVDPLAPRY